MTYDPSLVPYEELLKVFWRHIDPCTENGQGSDRGSQYRTGIYAHNAEQRHLAESSKRNLQIVTKMQDSDVGFHLCQIYVTFGPFDSHINAGH